MIRAPAAAPTGHAMIVINGFSTPPWLFVRLPRVQYHLHLFRLSRLHSQVLTSHHKTADERNQNRIRRKAREQEQDKEAVNAPTASYP